MGVLRFEVARLEHAKAIESMRIESAADLSAKLGDGPWSGSTKIASIRERIKCADTVALRATTLFVALDDDLVVGAVAVSTYPPGFWKQQYWNSGREVGLGVFGLVVPPSLQRKGIGRFLMQGIEELARSHGIRYIRLDAFSANPNSNGFYRAIGYEERAVIDLRGVGLVLFEKSV